MNRQDVFSWVKEEYDVLPDYPWDGDPAAVLRHPDNRKWFGLVMEVGRDKLGLPGSGTVTLLNVKCDPMLIGSYRAQPGFFPAYHMNKASWLTIQLDGPARDADVKSLIDISFLLTAAKKRRK